MAAILEMPQYVAYQKNVVYAFIKLSAKPHSFNILSTMNGHSCPTIGNDVTFILEVSLGLECRLVRAVIVRYSCVYTASRMRRLYTKVIYTS